MLLTLKGSCGKGRVLGAGQHDVHNVPPVPVQRHHQRSPSARFKPGAVSIDPLARGAIARAPAVAGAVNLLKKEMADRRRVRVVLGARRWRAHG